VRAAHVLAVAALVIPVLLTGVTGARGAGMRQGPEVAGSPRVRADDPERLDPLRPMVRRIDGFFRSHEVDGVTMDSRYAINPSEAIRMGVVCQLLGYCEYLKVHPTSIYRLMKANAGPPSFKVGRDYRFSIKLVDQWRHEKEANFAHGGKV